MIDLLLGLVLLSWIFGRERGLIGGLAGGFVGAFVLAGMARTARSGDLLPSTPQPSWPPPFFR